MIPVHKAAQARSSNRALHGASAPHHLLRNLLIISRSRSGDADARGSSSSMPGTDTMSCGIRCLLPDLRFC